MDRAGFDVKHGSKLQRLDNGATWKLAEQLQRSPAGGAFKNISQRRLLLVGPRIHGVRTSQPLDVPVRMPGGTTGCPSRRVMTIETGTRAWSPAQCESPLEVLMAEGYRQAFDCGAGRFAAEDGRDPLPASGAVNNACSGAHGLPTQ